MKRFKIKIKNPVARWFAGLGTIVVGIPMSLVIVAIILYGIGQLAEPLYWLVPLFVRLETFSVGPSIFWGLMMLCGAGLTVIGIPAIFYYGLYKGVRWTGNCLYNGVAQVGNHLYDSLALEK